MSEWSLQAGVRLGAFELALDLRGETGVTALIGSNGSGKTTAIRLMAGAVHPGQGRIQVGEACWFDSAADLLLPIESRRVGYVPQGFGLFPHLNVVDNVAFGLAFGGEPMGRRRRRDKAIASLESLGCGVLARRTIGELSGGERQRVALARALVIQPTLMLLDEPLSSLDIASRREVRGVLAEQLRRLACPTILVTHDVRDLAALDVGRVFVLEQGRVVQSGTPEDLRGRPANPFVAEFMGLPGAEPCR